MKDGNVAELLALLFQKLANTDNTTKFFNLDGSPAKDLSSTREDMIHINDVQDAMGSLISNNGKDTVKSIDKVNDPASITKHKDKYGLTDVHRKWLLEYIFCVEGGYFNHPNDPGGETMYGIIKKVAVENGYTGPMKDLPKEVATEIYLKKYWASNRLQEINDFKKGLCIFDFIVNSGAKRGIQAAQKAINMIVGRKNSLNTTKTKYAKLNPLLEDGVIGKNTLDAINMVDYDDFFGAYLIAQQDRYEKLQRANNKLDVFDSGWDNRMVTKVLFLNEIERQGL